MGGADEPSGPGGVGETDSWIRPGSYGFVGAFGNTICLEFDGLSCLSQGLKDFIERWASALARPKGTAFTVSVKHTALLVSEVPGGEPSRPRIVLGFFLLLRVDSMHPYFGYSDPGWVILRPNSDPSQSSEVLAAVRDPRPCRLGK